jgi:hypothetical protein
MVAGGFGTRAEPPVVVSRVPDGAPGCSVVPHDVAKTRQRPPLGPPPNGPPPVARLLPSLPDRPLAVGARRGDRPDARPAAHRERHPAPAGGRARASGRAAQRAASGR